MAGRPEDLQFVSAILLVSRHPERLVSFYGDVLGIPLEQERHGDTHPHWGCELGDIHFAIHPVDDYPEDSEVAAGAVKLAFMVFDLPRFTEWLASQGVPLCYPPRPLGSGSLITAVRDPDGNLVELTQLGTSWLEHLQGRRAGGHDIVQRWAHLRHAGD